MVANVENFPGSLDPLDEVSSCEPTAPTQFQLVEENSEIFCWKKVDSLRFVVQVILTLIIAGFCLGKLANSETLQEGDKAVYWGGITGIVAWWMPTPGAKGVTHPQK